MIPSFQTYLAEADLKDQKVPYRLNGAEPGKWSNAQDKALWAQLMVLLK